MDFSERRRAGKMPATETVVTVSSRCQFVIVMTYVPGKTDRELNSVRWSAVIMPRLPDEQTHHQHQHGMIKIRRRLQQTVTSPMANSVSR